MRLLDLTRRQFLSSTAGVGALSLAGSAVPLRAALAALVRELGPPALEDDAVAVFRAPQRP